MELWLKTSLRTRCTASRSTENPKQNDLRQAQPALIHIIIKMANDKDKEGF